MFDFLKNNLDKICIGIGAFYLLELGQKYYSLKYFNKYYNYEIKNQKVYQLEIYKKKIYKIPILDNKFNKKYDIKFVNYDYNNNEFSFYSSISEINSEINSEKKIYNDVEFKNPRKYIYYKNNKLLGIFLADLITKINCKKFINILQENKNNDDIKVKLIQSDNSLCLYDNDNLLLISDNKSDILKKVTDENINYMCMSLICAIFLYFYSKKVFQLPQ